LKPLESNTLINSAREKPSGKFRSITVVLSELDKLYDPEGAAVGKEVVRVLEGATESPGALER
jgi:hypothetical protein